MDLTLTAAIVSGIISAITSYLVTKLMDKSNKRESLENQLDNILKIAIEYPYLEDRAFIESWDQNRHVKDEKFLRYEIYTTLLFNYLSRLSLHFNYDSEKIENVIDIKTWVREHREYWKNPPNQFENIDGYGKEFCDFINKYIGV